jgi:hypothetical protein
MKKLLALVLCVMMFVAIIPTAAFADDALPQAADPTKAWPALSASKTAVDNAKKNIDSIYGSLAANNAVFGAVKSMDTLIGDLTKGLLEGVDGYDKYVVDPTTGKAVGYYTLSHDTLVDNAKAYLRGIIGNSIIDNMNDHLSDFVSVSKAKFNGENMYTWTSAFGGGTMRYVGNGPEASGIAATDSFTKVYKDDQGNTWGLNPDGSWYLANGERWSEGPVNNDYAFNYVPEYDYDPIKYANAFATAASKAFTSEKAAKGLESVIYNLYVLKAMDEASDKMDDFVTDVKNWDKDNEILAAYGFNGTTLPGLFDPYVFLNPIDLPKDVKLDASLFVPGDMDWAWPVA